MLFVIRSCNVVSPETVKLLSTVKSLLTVTFELKIALSATVNPDLIYVSFNIVFPPTEISRSTSRFVLISVLFNTVFPPTETFPIRNMTRQRIGLKFTVFQLKPHFYLSPTVLNQKTVLFRFRILIKWRFRGQMTE